MGRRVKWRRVEYMPSIQQFTPLDIENDDIKENVLKVEELEAMRLKDLEGLEQEECAVKMEISRQTFQRILNTARKKITDSLVNGKAVRIEGGNYTRSICPVKCQECSKEWNESYENFEKILDGKFACPDCGSKHIVCARSKKKRFCRNNCWKHGTQNG